jgi:maltose-binding protein MalE
MMFKFSKLATAVALVVATNVAMAGEVEVLHYWTSGGEAQSVAELKKIMQAKNHTWKDFAVAGGGGDNAATVLKSRVVSGNPPAAAQIKGPAIQEWAAEGVLANLDATAKAEKWDSLLPGVVANVMKYKGSYVAAPVNVHRVNWMWANAAVLKKAGVNSSLAFDRIKAVVFVFDPKYARGGFHCGVCHDVSKDDIDVKYRITGRRRKQAKCGEEAAKWAAMQPEAVKLSYLTPSGGVSSAR